MKVVKYLSDAGNLYNEDKIFFKDDYVLLLDGSTGLKKNLIKEYHSDAIWFVEQVTNYIERAIEHSEDTKTLIVNMLYSLRSSFFALLEDSIEVEAIDFPSASMVLVREKGDTIEICNIGDCTTVIEFVNNTLQVEHDQRVPRLDQTVVDKMMSLRANEKLDINEARKRVLTDLIFNRKKKNTVDGYDILGFDTLEPNLMIKSFDRKTIANICIFSDGFEAYYSTLGLANNVSDFYQLLQTENLSQLIEHIRTIENQDEDCIIYPRLKKSDDASVVLVRVNG